MWFLRGTNRILLMSLNIYFKVFRFKVIFIYKPREKTCKRCFKILLQTEEK